MKCQCIISNVTKYISNCHYAIFSVILYSKLLLQKLTETIITLIYFNIFILNTKRICLFNEPVPLLSSIDSIIGFLCQLLRPVYIQLIVDMI